MTLAERLVAIVGGDSRTIPLNIAVDHTAEPAGRTVRIVFRALHLGEAGAAFELVLHSSTPLPHDVAPGSGDPSGVWEITDDGGRSYRVTQESFRSDTGTVPALLVLDRPIGADVSELRLNVEEVVQADPSGDLSWVRLGLRLVIATSPHIAPAFSGAAHPDAREISGGFSYEISTPSRDSQMRRRSITPDEMAELLARQQALAAPGSLVRVVAVGQAVELDAHVVEILALEIRGSVAYVTWRSNSERDRGWTPSSPHLEATDDVGTLYRTIRHHWSGGGGTAEGTIAIAPPPPATAHVLTLSIQRGDVDDWSRYPGAAEALGIRAPGRPTPAEPAIIEIPLDGR